MPGDRFLLCSDGLCGLVDEDQIAHILARGPVEDTVMALVDTALVMGAPDNVTPCASGATRHEGRAPADDRAVAMSDETPQGDRPDGDDDATRIVAPTAPPPAPAPSPAPGAGRRQPGTWQSGAPHVSGSTA